MQGALGPGTLVDLVRRIRQARQTGVLHLMQGSDFRNVRFRGGEVVHGTSSRPEERLGAVLLRDGLASAEDLERADDIVTRDRKRLAESLVELGVLDNRGAEDALARHGREVLYGALAAQGGFYAFQEDDADTPLERQATLRFSSAAMALEAARRLTDSGAVDFALGDLDRVLHPSADLGSRFQATALNTVDGFVVSRVDGQLTASQIIDSIGLPPEDTRKSLLCLLCAGLIRFADEAATRVAHGGGTFPAPPSTGAYRKIFRSTPPATGPFPADPEAAPTDATAGPDHPPQAAAAALHAIQDCSASVEAELAAPAELSPEQLEMLLSAAKAYMARARYWEAIQALQRLVPASKGLLQQKAKVLLAEAYLKNPNWLRRAEVVLLELTQGDNPDLDGLLLLAGLYRQSNRKGRAVATYRRALAHAPENELAVAALRELEPEDDGPGGAFS